jgi:hypothetical protein
MYVQVCTIISIWFNMDEEHIKYMRFGGKEGQDGIDRTDLGFFDPSGGPFVAVSEVKSTGMRFTQDW